MKIIPAIDLIDGKCVRLRKGDYATQKVYRDNPLEVAKEFEDNGIEYLHLVDLDGAKAGHVVNQKVLNAITSQTNLSVDFGGGLRSTEDLTIAFECGAKQVTAGSVAVKNPLLFEEWIDTFGGEKIILGADFQNRHIAIFSWSQSVETDVVSFIKNARSKGIQTAICTDVSKDGMLAGPSFELYTEILSETSVNLIASGGVSTVQDLIRLREMGCSGAIIGKAIYEGNISLNQLRELC